MSTERPEEQRVDLDELRGQLGATVEELAHRADVPAQVRARRDMTVARAKEAGEQVKTVVTDRGQQAKAFVAERAPVVRDAATRSPGLVAAGAAAALLVLVLLLRRGQNTSR
jgi:hypothetical protein